jgi:hypothetical protein
MLRICEPCVYRCHRGHKGVRLVRISPVVCGCNSVCQPVNPCCAHEISAIQLKNVKLAQQQSAEQQRQELLNLLMPPVFAMVPKYSPEGILKKESGYLMCRRSPSRNLALQRLIETRSLTSAVDSSDPLIQNHEPSVPESPSQDLIPIPPTVPQGENQTLDTGTTNTTLYLRTIEHNLLGNIYTDDRDQPSPVTPLPPPLPPVDGMSTAELITHLQQNPHVLLFEEELNESLRSQGWISVMDSEEPTSYEPGTKILCHSKSHEIPCYATIVQYLANGVYLAKFFDGHEENVSCEAIESVIRRSFYFNPQTGYATWTFPQEEEEGVVVTSTYGQPPEYLELSGTTPLSLSIYLSFYHSVSHTHTLSLSYLAQAMIGIL